MRIKLHSKHIKHPSLWDGLGGLLVVFALLSSCSAEEEEASEWDNWQPRNEAFFQSLADSLSRDPGHWQRIKNFSLDPATEGAAGDYIYVKTIEQGSGTESPAYTDSVRVVYQGRLIPTTTYPEGYVFDGTVYGRFTTATASTAKQLTSRMVDGYATALQHMHRGDHWRVYIPWELGYGSSGSSSGAVPGYSTIIFEMALIDFCPAGETLPTWSARQR